MSKKRSNERLLTVFTDASYTELRAGGKGSDVVWKASGMAVWAKFQGYTFKWHGRFKFPAQSSLEAEYLGMIKGVILAHKYFKKEPKVAVCKCDCLVAVNMLNRDQAIVDRLSREALTYWKEYRQANSLTVHWRHVKGHNNDGTPRTWVNNWCDEYAKKARMDHERLFKA